MLEEATHYPGIVESQNLKVNWSNLMDYKHKVIDPMAGQLNHYLNNKVLMYMMVQV